MVHNKFVFIYHHPWNWNNPKKRTRSIHIAEQASRCLKHGQCPWLFPALSFDQSACAHNICYKLKTKTKASQSGFKMKKIPLQLESQQGWKYIVLITPNEHCFLHPHQNKFNFEGFDSDLSWMDWIEKTYDTANGIMQLRTNLKRTWK